KYLTATSDYKELGEYWESLGGSWGGRFKTRPDGNHFSLEHNGVR
ncbi:MAG: M15 family metallopeptidase, partial [Proteus vulgaris]